MARKKKGKSTKNSISSVLSGKSVGQPPRVLSPHAKNGKTGHGQKTPPAKSGINPAKPPDKSGPKQPQSSVTRKTTTNTNGSAGTKSNAAALLLQL